MTTPYQNSSHLLQRSNSISQASEDSQTAQDFINSQLELEAEAREVLPYQFDTCTRALGALRQSLFSCLTCNPPPSNPSDHYNAAGLCYSCSISCHGEHELVELFNKRDFVCDCGTTRLPESAPCTLRINSKGVKANVTGEEPAKNNKYNQNYRNRFCSCSMEYDPHQEKGTMFQCLGLGTIEDGGCGEDWYHAECLMDIPRNSKKTNTNGGLGSVKEEEGNGQESDGQEENNQESNIAAGEVYHQNLPEGFPNEDDFENLICFKCVEAFPWIKRYAGTTGFLKPIVHGQYGSQAKGSLEVKQLSTSLKRKSEEPEHLSENSTKRVRAEDDVASPALSTSATTATTNPASCLYEKLPSSRINDSNSFSLVTTETFRENLCHCPSHFSLLKSHPYLLEEEETYEPPLSTSSGDDIHNGGGSAGSRGSLLDRGEAALSNVDRVRAIEGVMVYNHLKEKVKNFLKPFAENGKAVSAEDIKAYFEGLRGDAEGIQKAGKAVGSNSDENNEDDTRKEQSGY